VGSQTLTILIGPEDDSIRIETCCPNTIIIIIKFCCVWLIHHCVFIYVLNTSEWQTLKIKKQIVPRVYGHTWLGWGCCEYGNEISTFKCSGDLLRNCAICGLAIRFCSLKAHLTKLHLSTSLGRICLSIFRPQVRTLHWKMTPVVLCVYLYCAYHMRNVPHICIFIKLNALHNPCKMHRISFLVFVTFWLCVYLFENKLDLLLWKHCPFSAFRFVPWWCYQRICGKWKAEQ